MLFSRRTLLLTGAAAAAALALSGCSGAGDAAPAAAGADGTIAVVASTNVYGDIAAEIGGSHVTVHSIISKAGADPHGYEANAQDKLAVSKAQVGIENGGGYDDFFGQLAKGQLDPAETINVSELSGLDTGDGFNEHVWYSLPTMTKLADDLAGRFSALRPEQAADFTKQADAFKAKVAALESRLAALKEKHEGEPAAITEPVPLYLLEQAGLVNKTPHKFTEAVENGSDVPAAVLKETLELMGSGKLDLLAYNEQTGSPQTEEVRAAATAAGVPVADFAETLPQETSYIEWMDQNVSSLEKALQSPAAP